ncbi:MAG: tol-pal system-associated acyl-CoA thioesterase [Burkholderiales bacterium]
MTSGRRTDISLALPIRVYYQDTDAAGVVFHATYLNFLERARVEWLRARGFELREMADRYGVFFIVRTLEIAYVRPAQLDDLVHATARVQKMGRVQVTFAQTVLREAEELVRAQVNLACVSAEGFRPAAIPEPLRATFAEGVASVTGAT